MKFVAFFLLLAGCGVSQVRSESKEAINPANDPDRIGLNFQLDRNPDMFPDSGQSRKEVWSGDWWPLSEGGTVAAMRKYDLITGSRAESWEKQTAVMSGHVSWAGHCNGLAGAGINELRPQRSVTYQGINFSVADIEALLVEKWQGTSEITLVGRRCQKDIAPDSSGRIPSAECRDFNPGSFHILLGNLLGNEKKAFVIDISAGEQVWNYPVVAYQTHAEVIDRREAIRLTAQSVEYKFNPSADQFMKVRTSLRLATGTTKTYEYVLEGLDEEIVGGEWINESRTDHPDFAWQVERPTPANPFLDIDVIDAIARQSF